MNNDNLVWVFGIKDGVFNAAKCVGVVTCVCSRPYMEGTMLRREGEGREGDGRGEGRGGKGRGGERRGGEGGGGGRVEVRVEWE